MIRGENNNNNNEVVVLFFSVSSVQKKKKKSAFVALYLYLCLSWARNTWSHAEAWTWSISQGSEVMRECSAGKAAIWEHPPLGWRATSAFPHRTGKWWSRNGHQLLEQGPFTEHTLAFWIWVMRSEQISEGYDSLSVTWRAWLIPCCLFTAQN